MFETNRVSYLGQSIACNLKFDLSAVADDILVEKIAAKPYVGSVYKSRFGFEVVN